MIVEVNNKTKSKIDLALIKKTAKKFLLAYKKKKEEVSIAFVGDRAIRRLNKIYRKIDKVTDVLTFPADGGTSGADDLADDGTGETSAGEDNFLGEIVIDYEQIKRQAKQSGRSAKKELIFILVHGLLHLVGYNDETEKERLEMIKKGEEFIGNLGFILWNQTVQKLLFTVIPAKAGIQDWADTTIFLDPRVKPEDDKREFSDSLNSEISGLFHGVKNLEFRNEMKRVWSK